MKLLVISHKPPYPIVDGGTFAIANCIELLIDSGFEVSLFTLSTPKHPFKPTSKEENNLLYVSVNSFVDTSIKPIEALKYLISSVPYNVQRFYSNSAANKLIKHLQQSQYDIVQIESPVLFPYLHLIRKHSKAKVFYRAHNLEFEIFEQRSTIEKNWLKKRYLKHIASQLKEYEISYLSKFDKINFISSRDETVARKLAKINSTFSIALSFKDIPKANNSDLNKNVFGIIGSMNWEPNVESTKWFIENVWFNLFEKYKTIRLVIAGNHMDNSILKYNNNYGISVLSSVKKLTDFYNSISTVIIPLKLGSGLKIKTIEALKYNKLVISTSIGLQGINNIHEANIITCNSANEFQQKIEQILSKKLNPESISNINIDFIEKYYSNRKNIDRVKTKYRTN